jgi:ubiquinone/menaquinone biosynthesis C-methylase UbiE
MAAVGVRGISAHRKDIGSASAPTLLNPDLPRSAVLFSPQIAIPEERYGVVRRAERKSADSAEQSRPYVIHSDEECERLELQARLAKIDGHLRHLPISAHDRVLDVGCGSGSMARLIARSFPRSQVVGVDLREQYLDFAKARAAKEKIRNLAFRRGDVFALPFPDASFDVVWAKYLLQWLKEPERALAELKRVTKPGGFVVSCDYVGFAVEHFPIEPEFERQVRDGMAALVDCNIGRKVAPFMISLGFRDVHVEMETDTLFTVIGKIDAERRRNWVTQFQAARPHLVQIAGSEANADRLIDLFLAHYDNPATCSFTALYFTRGRL